MSTERRAPGGPKGRRLRPRTRKAILLVHVIASVALVGVVWVLIVLGLYAILTEDRELARAAYRLMEPLAATGGIPLSLTALVSGIVLGLGSSWGLVRHYWVLAKLLLLIGVILVGAILSNPGELAAVARPAAARQWGQVAAVTAQIVMLVTATALSIFKPRGRVGGRRRSRPAPVRETAAGG